MLGKKSSYFCTLGQRRSERQCSTTSFLDDTPLSYSNFSYQHDEDKTIKKEQITQMEDIGEGTYYALCTYYVQYAAQS